MTKLTFYGAVNEIGGSKLDSKEDCYEYDNYDCLCWDCKNNEEDDDFIIL